MCILEMGSKAATFVSSASSTNMTYKRIKSGQIGDNLIEIRTRGLKTEVRDQRQKLQRKSKEMKTLATRVTFHIFIPDPDTYLETPSDPKWAR